MEKKTLNFSKAQSLRFGAGELIVEYGASKFALEHYDGGGPSAVRFIYSENGPVCQFDSLAELVPLARSRSISIELEATSNPREWARLVSAVYTITHPPDDLSYFAILRDHRLAKDHYGMRGVNYEEFKPNVESGKLIWHVIKSLDPRTKAKWTLLRYECDLSTFDVSSTVVRVLPDLP